MIHRLKVKEIVKKYHFPVNIIGRRHSPQFLASIQCRFYQKPAVEDFQYLQRSIVPTMHFEKSLPRLPIPDLENTCERYLKALKPITKSDKLEKTVKIVEKFKCEEGKVLQEELKASNARNKHTSYISGPWFEMYLKSRVPIVLNYNPFIAFKDDPNKEYNTQILRSTNMLISSLRFLKSLREGILEPEVYHLNPEKSDTLFYRRIIRMFPKSVSWYGSYLFKAFPLDMSQFNNLFNSTRIPHLDKDQIQVFPEARHIMVLRNGYFYLFDVIDSDGNILPPSHIYSHLAYILTDTRSPPSHPISYLTTENRDTWAEQREHLEQLGNTEQLRLIDSALFALILDEEVLNDDLVKASHQMLHGPAFNRWFDKSFQLIISKDGKAAINFEHAWGDGVAMLRYFNSVFEDSTKNHFVGPKTLAANVDASHRVRRLDFVLDETIKSAVRKARDTYNQTTSTLQLSPLLYSPMTRDSIKGHKLSPDSVAQLALQMAFYKIHGKFVATYESCSTSAFKHGRTETVRPATAETARFVEEIHKRKRISDSELRKLMKECTRTHNQLTKEAAMGQGFDRHLFGLKNIAERRGMKIPDLYLDQVYQDANHFVLSTSTLFGPAFDGGGFAPVVKDGFGISYGFPNDNTGYLVSTYSTYRDGQALVDALKLSLEEINSILEKTKS